MNGKEDKELENPLESTKDVCGRLRKLYKKELFMNESIEGRFKEFTDLQSIKDQLFRKITKYVVVRIYIAQNVTQLNNLTKIYIYIIIHFQQNILTNNNNTLYLQS